MVAFGKSRSKSSNIQNFDQTSTPYGPAAAPIQNILNRSGGYTPGLTDRQSTAYDQLLQNVQGGNPFQDDISRLAGDLLNQPGYGDTAVARDEYRSNIGQILNENPDPYSNPVVSNFLNQQSQDLQGQLNRQFTAGGAQLSPAHARALGQGVATAQAPGLFGYYNQVQDRKLKASNDLFQVNQNAATTQAGLDSTEAQIRLSGLPVVQQALDATNYGANQTLNLDQQMKDLPLQDLAQLAALVYPAAGFGGRVQGSGTSTGKTSGTSVGFSLSDARAKKDIKQIGKTDEGLPLYSYKYKGEDEPRVGPMAQDVAIMKPEAVAHASSGLLYINLEQAIGAI